VPTGTDTFNPVFGSYVATAGAPAIAQWTQSAGPGNTISLSVVNASALPPSGNNSDTQFVTYSQTTGNNGMLTSDAIAQIGSGLASVSLNSQNATNSMYFLWAKNANGYSAPVAINKTTAWWLGPTPAGPGQTVSVYGENLTYTTTDGLSWIYITKSDGTGGQWATVTSANPYQVAFTVPTNLATGTYEVWAHNGHGGQYGWSNPLTLTVAPQLQYTGKVFNVLSYGAVPNNAADDTAGFTAALNAAVSSGAGSTVYVPAGTYVVSGITMPSGVQLLGAGQGVTIINENSSLGSNPPAQLLMINSNIQIANLTLSTNGVATADLIANRGFSNVRFVNDTINAGLNQYGDFHLDQDVFLQGCTITGSGGFWGTASQVFVDHCNFYATNDADNMFYTWGGRGISITNCTVQDLNDSNSNSGAGWGQGRFFVGSDNWGSQTDTYIANNTTIAMGVRPAYSDQNAGEQILWEGNDFYAGTYVGSTANTVTFTGMTTPPAVGSFAIIVGGDGAGEYAPIASYNTATGVATLAQPWLVTPDSTSVVEIGKLSANLAVYKNTLQGKGVTNTASTGVQFWGGAVNAVVDSNTISNVRGGVTDVGVLHSGKTTVLPAYFNLIQNNTVTNGQYGILIRDNAIGSQIATIGTVIRNNTVNTASTAAIELCDLSSLATPFYVIAEYNTATNVPAGVDIVHEATATTYLVLNSDSLTLGSAAFSGSAAVSVNQLLVLVQQNNTFSGFQVTYGGSVAPTIASTPQAQPVSFPALQSSVGATYAITGSAGADVLDVTARTVMLTSDLWAYLGNYTLKIEPGAEVVLGSNQNLGGLQIVAGGKLDVGTYSMKMNYGAGADPKATILQYLRSGSNGGAWNGLGIFSSAAAGTTNYGVGFGDGADHITASLSSGQIEIAYAIFGDANLDGFVNAVDSQLVSTNLNKSVTSGWENGDFTYLGLVNAVDSGYVSANLNKAANYTPQPVSGVTTPSGAQVTVTASNGTQVVDVKTGSVVLTADLSASFGSYALKIENGAKAVLASNQHLASLVLAGNGTLNVASYGVTINYGNGADPKATLLGYLARGSNSGTWNGTGIVSSIATAKAGYGVGFADGADGVVYGLPAGLIEITYALEGDANLDGTVNGSDASIVSSNLNKSVANGWEAGDFNYDGVVNAIDFGYISTNLNKGAVTGWAAAQSATVQNGAAILLSPRAMTNAATSTSTKKNARRSG
jgi:hypothetical protein